METVRKHGGIKFLKTEARNDYLVLESNYHTANLFSENLLVTEIRKTYKNAILLRSINVRIK